MTSGGAPTSQLVLVSGGNQTATVGDQLGQPIRVMAQDAQGNPIAGVQVLFQPTVDALGQGSLDFQLSSPSDVTGDDGMAETFVTTSTVAGSNNVRVMAPDLPDASQLLVSNFGTPAPATALVLEAGDTQAAVANQNFGAPLVVAVADQFGNPVPDTQVTFAVATVTRPRLPTERSPRLHTCTLSTSTSSSSLSPPTPSSSSSSQPQSSLAARATLPLLARSN